MELIKEKTVFILRGKENSGKTETLLRLCRMLSGVSDTFEINHYSQWTHDCYGVFYFGNKAVCVCTAGDNKEEIEGNIEFSTKKKASIIVSAISAESEKRSSFEKLLDDFAQSKKYQKESLNKKDYKTNSAAAYELFKKIFMEEKRK